MLVGRGWGQIRSSLVPLVGPVQSVIPTKDIRGNNFFGFSIRTSIEYLRDLRAEVDAPELKAG